MRCLLRVPARPYIDRGAGLYENLGRYEPTLPNKIANATDFYFDTLNFVAIRRFSAATVVFRCVRVTCCHKNFSVAIKIVIVATR